MTWDEIAKFSGANETPYSLRHASKGKEKIGSSSRSKEKEKEKVSEYRLVDEDDEEGFEEDGIIKFDNLDLCDEEDEFVISTIFILNLN